MSTVAPTSVAECVANGAQLLDDNHPGWWQHINLGTLDISDICQCVCAQMNVALNGADPEEPRWTEFAYTLRGADGPFWTYGFAGGLGTWKELTDEWKLAIQARLDADQADTVHEAQEMMLV